MNLGGITMKKIRILTAFLLLLALIGGAALADGYVEATASVNLRSGPGLSYRDLGTIHKGDTLSYLDKNSTDSRGVVWYKVKYDGSSAWISSKYSELYGEIFVYATGGKSYLRKTPSLSGKALVVMHEDEAAEYLGKTSVDDRGVAWYKVDFDGTVGWVSSKYTTLGEDEVYTREIVADGGQSYIRDEPSLDGNKLAVFHKNESATYLEKRSIDGRGVVWYKVVYNGTVGWVSSRYSSVY